jgi:3-deoxy-manno-octulosonate cytidylyltransferase (CMP-KDO synthetase)
VTEPFRVVIPARMASVRLPGKPLLDIGGAPMVVRVVERARASDASEVVVATDDERIVTASAEFGADSELTSPMHASGTDRIAEVAARRKWSDDSIVVNVQGDEPLLPSELIDQVAGLLAVRPDAAVATLTAPLGSEAEYRDPNIVKVVSDQSGLALYFSRSPIPADRDGGIPTISRRHVGLYAYRVGALRSIAAADSCGYEQAERLEQLRALWLGLRIVVADACMPPPRGVDTPDDLSRVRAEFASRNEVLS